MTDLGRSGTARIDGYAAGLFEIARGEGQLDRVERELHTVGRALESSDELRTTLADMAVPVDRKQGIVADLLGGRGSEVTVAALDMLIATGRVGDLPAIANGLIGVAAASRAKEVAEVRSAVVLDAETVSRIEAALSKATGRPVEAKVVVDPTVVGGIVARVGDVVIDGSVRRRLDSVRQALGA